MWNHAIRQVTQHSLRNSLLALLAVLLLLAAAPALAQTDTPTPTATVAPATDDVCVFLYVFRLPYNPDPNDGKSLYIKFPANDYLTGTVNGLNTLIAAYTDANCETKADWIVESIPHGGFAHAKGRDTAWDICAANNSNKITDITLIANVIYLCVTSNEPAPPAGQLKRFLRVGHVGPVAPDNDPLSAAEALTACQAKWSNANSVAYHWPGPLAGTWKCQVSWTAVATPTPDPNGNSGSEAMMEELIVYGHGFGRTADAGLAECQRKWSDTDAISRHPKLEKYWACLKSQTDQSETPTPTATATATDTPTATSTSTATATATDTPTATAAPAEDFVCVLHWIYEGEEWYHKYPESRFISVGRHPYYTDTTCEIEVDGTSDWVWSGGFVYAGDGDTAWDLCIANNTMKVTRMDHLGTGMEWWCIISDEPAPPGGQTERFLRVGYVEPVAPDFDPLSAEEALTKCKTTWPNVNSVAYHWGAIFTGTWECLISWTVEATPTPDPNGNSGSNAELIKFGHGFGRTADAGFAECQRKWSDTDAIARHPKLEKYWACMGSQTEEVEAPGRASDLSAAVSGGSVSLTWDAPADGGAATGYRILRRLPQKGEKNLGVLANNTGSASTSYSDSSAEAGQKHVYRVQALGPGGEGQVSKPAQIVLSG